MNESHNQRSYDRQPNEDAIRPRPESAISDQATALKHACDYYVTAFVIDCWSGRSVEARIGVVLDWVRRREPSFICSGSESAWKDDCKWAQAASILP
ncbi:hypothetical protein THAOC_20432 [Thalassiosira oceanica]|uniref:Uncharacterized protein n=1 Tax=Thalassiosira oceanica TaxID=159749 RepID=K0SEJ2_THAOC|nr:hypothetical protein THAOC_20432 [Thalassiosira oceanica]|eukprot:EJK59361.1 hypothetical protein THAOC_20432 [Thalassiosira oceanica]